jgi:hypothetical protein
LKNIISFNGSTNNRSKRMLATAAIRKELLLQDNEGQVKFVAMLPALSSATGPSNVAELLLRVAPQYQTTIGRNEQHQASN